LPFKCHLDGVDEQLTRKKAVAAMQMILNKFDMSVSCKSSDYQSFGKLIAYLLAY